MILGTVKAVIVQQCRSKYTRSSLNLQAGDSLNSVLDGQSITVFMLEEEINLTFADNLMFCKMIRET